MDNCKVVYDEVLFILLLSAIIFSLYFVLKCHPEQKVNGICVVAVVHSPGWFAYPTGQNFG